MQDVYLKEFEAFIVARKLVAENRRTFYLNWVVRFLKAEFNISDLENNDKVGCFADQFQAG